MATLLYLGEKVLCPTYNVKGSPTIGFLTEYNHLTVLFPKVSLPLPPARGEHRPVLFLANSINTHIHTNTCILLWTECVASPPPPHHMLKPNPQCVGMRMWGLWAVTRS